MPANLPPPYHKAEDRYRAAKTTEEKIEALEEMLRLMPKHKGTDALQADVKSRIAKLRKQPEKKSARAGHSYMIPRSGAGQIALVGPPNAGKSSLVARLTHATPEVAEYPFTTREPIPGMMPFEDVAFQLIDLPAISSEHVEPWVFDLIRRADLLWIVLSAQSALEEMEEVRGLLEAKHIGITPATPGVADAASAAGSAAATPAEDAGATGDEVPSGLITKKCLLIVTGLDRPGAPDDVATLGELLADSWRPIGVSCTTAEGLGGLGKVTFDAMNVIRVYTKEPGKPADRKAPFTLPRGATLGDLAERIHKDILAGLKYARIWGTHTFDGQTVQREHVLHEGDIVEIHA